jgi:hypothetical protein
LEHNWKDSRFLAQIPTRNSQLCLFELSSCKFQVKTEGRSWCLPRTCCYASPNKRQ